MKDAFYLINTGTEEKPWYQLRLYQNHFCYSSGPSLQERLDTLHRVVKRHRNEENMMSALENLQASGMPSAKERAWLQNQLDTLGCVYQSRVEQTILSAQREVAAERKQQHSKKVMLAKRLKPAIINIVKPAPPEATKKPGRVRLPILPKKLRG